VLERKGNINEALANYQEAATLDPNNSEAHYNLGLIFLRHWQPRMAIRHLERVLQISPGFLLAQKNLIKAKKMLEAQNK